MVAIKNIIVHGDTITIETGNGCVLDYEIDSFKCKEILPTTPPSKIESTPKFDEFKKKHIHSITKTDSELILDFEKYENELHLCHDHKSVEMYSTKRRDTSSRGKRRKPRRDVIITDVPNTPVTPYVIDVFQFT